MALSPDRFTEPVGPYAAHLFPVTDAEREGGETDDAKLEWLLGAWITEAQTRHADSEALQSLYVEMRADASVYARLLSMPASANAEGEGSYSYSAQQLAAWKARSERSAARYDGAVDAGTNAPVRRLPRRSVSVAKNVVWAGGADVDEFGAAPVYP